jgi:formate dehydrogenase maturation protein FdhE
MAFDFDKIFKEALSAGVTAAKPGGKAAEEWIRESAKANEETLRAIAEGILKNQISKESGEMLLRESARALQSEAAALSVISKATAQAAVNAFLNSLSSALTSALKLAF